MYAVLIPSFWLFSKVRCFSCFVHVHFFLHSCAEQSFPCLPEAGKALAVRQNKSLELSMAAASSRESSLHSQRIHESDRADELLRTQLKRCYELQAKLQGEMEQKAEAEAAARVAEAQMKKIKDERDREQHNAAREIVQLKMELDRLRRDSNDTLSRIKAEVGNCKPKINMC
jgi:phosphatidylinositol kinase/protein kinase (PI-3  family)